MMGRMDDQFSRQALRALTDVLDASVRDIATGNVGDAAAVQHEAKRMLAEFEIARSGTVRHGRGTTWQYRKAPEDGVTAVVSPDHRCRTVAVSGHARALSSGHATAARAARG